MNSKRRRTIVRLLGWVIGVFASFFAVLLLVLVGYLLFSDYPEKLRQALESELTRLSGAPAMVREIRLDLPRYAFELRGISLGAPGREGPVLELDRVWGKLRLSELLNLRLQWNELVFEGLTVTLIEDREEGLRFPSRPADAPLGGIALAADRISVQRAVLVIANERVPWTLEGRDLSLELERLRNERYQGKLTYEDGRLRLKGREEFGASVTADFEIVPREIFLRQGRATSDFGWVQATGKLGLADGVRARFEVEGEGDSGQSVETLLGVRGASKLLEGRASFRGSISIEPGAKTLEGTLLLPDGRIAGVPLSGWSGEIFWDRSILQVGYARGTIAGGGAKLQIHQPLPLAEHRASADLDIEGAWLSRILSGASGAASPLESLLSGRGSFTFSGERPQELEGSFEVRGIEPDPNGPPSTATALSLQARGRIDEEVLHVDDLQFRTSFLEGTLAGIYPREGSALFSVDIESTDLAATDFLQQELRKLASVETGALPPAWGVSGRGRAQGQLTGRVPNPSFRGELTAEDLSIDDIPLGAIRADAILSGEEVRFEDLAASSEDGSLAGRGSFSLIDPFRNRDFDLDLTLSRWPAAELAEALGAPYEIEGSLSGDIDCRREGDRLGGTAELEIVDSRLLGLDFERGNARLGLDGARVRLDPVTLVHAGSDLTGHLDLDFQARSLTGAFRAEGFPLEGIGPEWAALGGVVDGEIAFSGPIEKPVAELTGRGQAIRLAGLDLGEAFLSGSVREGAMDLMLSMEPQAAELVLQSRVALRGDYPAEGSVRWSGIDVAPWWRPPSETAAPLRVASNGTAEFRGELGADEPLRAMEVDAEVNDLVLESESYRVASIAPVKLHLRDARLLLEKISIAEAGSRLALSGSLELVEGALDIEAHGVASLGLLSSFYPGVAASGETTLSAAITGTLERPSITGYADFDGGSVRLDGFRQALAGLSGRMVFDNRTIRIAELHAFFGSGPVEISGTIALEGFHPGSVDLTLRGSGIRLRYPDGLNATLEGELSLLGSTGERMLSGSLVLRDALWSREYDLVSGILSDREGLALFGDFAGNELLENLRLDVAIRAPQSLQVRNSLAVIEASAELELRGTLGHPILLGRSVADHGDIYFLGQRYQITSGTVDFVNPERLEPFVDLTAETRVRSYRVELRLTGTPDRFHPELSSDPPLRTVDILRLLAGATERELLDNLVGTEAEELAGVGVASLLTERLSQEVGRRAERLFGLNRFSVNPFLVGQFANPTARVSLGKQISRELSINYSTNLNAATEAIILIEYTPEGPMSWILSRDEEGDVGIDVKFRKSF